MLKVIAKNIQRIQLVLGVACISIFFITIIIQVVCRYTGITVIWTGEVSTYTFIWSVFMGAGVMTYENKHFAFTSFSDKPLREIQRCFENYHLCDHAELLAGNFVLWNSYYQ